MLISAKLYTTIGAIVEGDAANTTPAAEYLMILTSLVLLAPAKYAFDAGRPWHAAIFTIMAVVCTVYHICDAKPPSLLGVHCPQPVLHALTLADHGCAYFCFVQMALLLLGPEDHNLQWPHEATTSNKPWKRVPMSVLLYSRALPLLGLLLFLAFYPAWQEFHYQMVLLCVVVVLHGAAQFWLSRTRREHAPKVLLHAVFWRRLGSLGVLPLFICLIFFVGMENLQVGSGLAHAAWHVLVAILAMNVQRTIYHSLPDPLHRFLNFLVQHDAPVSNIHSTSPKNPVVAQCLLGSIAITLALTLAAGYMSGLMVHYSSFDWPVFGLDLLQWQCGYIFAIGSLFVLAAYATTFGLISTVQGNVEGKRQLTWRHMGCSLGYIAAFFGLVTVAASTDGTPAHLRALAVATTVCTVATSVLLLTFSEPWGALTLASQRMVAALQRTIAAGIAIAATGFMTSLYVLYRYGALQHVVPGAFQHVGFPTAWHTLAFSQYLMVTLLVVFPWTYADQVYDRWASKKPLNAKWANWPFYVAGIES